MQFVEPGLLFLGEAVDVAIGMGEPADRKHDLAAIVSRKLASMNCCLNRVLPQRQTIGGDCILMAPQKTTRPHGAD